MSGVTDPLADMLTRIRNAAAGRQGMLMLPASSLRLAVAQILKAEGFVRDVELVPNKPTKSLKITLRYDEQKAAAFRGLERVSSPGCRIYVGKGEIPRVKGGLGMTIISTPQGIMTGREARAKGVGGEILCKVW
ncbi:MAG: 30S ribosomal protein S8 [Dehalococcoidia bacterium]|nr:30S ribosomal protein S8 [Dehalococcoidia bacterium]